jgi:hypothetical protein
VGGNPKSLLGALDSQDGFAWQLYGSISCERVHRADSEALHTFTPIQFQKVFMQSLNLPKPVLAAINRNAFRIAKTEAYAALKQDLEKRARTLMEQPHATIEEVVAVLDSSLT